MKSILLAALALAACGGRKPAPMPAPTPTEPAPRAACTPGGCSGTLCTDAGNGMMSTCEFRAEYACYDTATCERQGDGTCGWTQTAELTACLANPPPM